jgi:pimeloyl-ACP methyl ester carboxylesterase
LVDGDARLKCGEDYLPIPNVFTDESVEEIRAGWGQDVLMRRLAPDELADASLMERFAEYERQSASPGMAAAMLRMLYESDVRRVLPAIRVPTLVITHKGSARIPPDCSRYLADHIDGARSVELPGSQNLIWAGDQSAVIDVVHSARASVARRSPARCSFLARLSISSPDPTSCSPIAGNTYSKAFRVLGPVCSGLSRAPFT